MQIRYVDGGSRRGRVALEHTVVVWRVYMERMERAGEERRDAERPPGTPGTSQDGTDPRGGRCPTQPTPKPEVTENTIPYSPVRGTRPWVPERGGARASEVGDGALDEQRFIHPAKHRGTAERERSTAPELH